MAYKLCKDIKLDENVSAVYFDGSAQAIYDLQKLLKEAGFMKYDVPACIYLEDVEVYNQPLQYNYEYIDTKGMCGRTVNRCGKCENKEK